MITLVDIAKTLPTLLQDDFLRFVFTQEASPCFLAELQSQGYIQEATVKAMRHLERGEELGAMIRDYFKDQ